LKRTVREPANERRGIQVLNDGNSESSHRGKLPKKQSIAKRDCGTTRSSGHALKE
jgi:hypothetical protein